MEQWSAFLQDRWYVVAIAIIVLLLVVKLVKTVVKWIIVLAVAALLLFYGYQYKDSLQVDQIKEAVSSSVIDPAKDRAVTALFSEAKEAKYTANEDGTFTVTSNSIRLEGKTGSNEVKVSFMGTPAFSMKVDETVKKFIEQAKQNR